MLHGPSKLARQLIFTVALGVCAATTSFSSRALADDLAKAKVLFQEGLSLEGSNDFVHALEKFQQVETIKRTPQVSFHIALCQEKLGRYSEALGKYRLAQHDASELQSKNAKPDPKLDEVMQKAGDAITSIEKRQPSITLKKPADVTKVTLDGVVIAGEMLKKPIKLDPGSHLIEAVAPGKEPFKTSVELADGENKTIEVKLKEGSPDKKPDEKKPDDKKGDDKKPDEKKPEVQYQRNYLVPAIVAGSGVLIGTVGGLYFGMQRNSALNDLNKECVTGTVICRESAKSTSDKGSTAATLTNVSLIVGGAAVVTGAVLYFVLPQKEVPASAPSESGAWRSRKFDVAFAPTDGGASAHVVGKF